MPSTQACALRCLLTPPVSSWVTNRGTGCRSLHTVAKEKEKEKEKVKEKRTGKVKEEEKEREGEKGT